MAGESIDPLVTPEKSGFDSRNMGKNSAGNPGSLPVAPVENEFNSRKMGKISARNSGSPTDGISARGHHRRASIDSYHTGGRRYSGGKPDSASLRQQIVPHYLRASTGSCHDICKYGGRHVFEETTRKRLQKRIVKPSSTGVNSVDIIVSGEQKKEKVVKHERSSVKKPSPDIKSYSPKLKASFDANTSSRRSASSSNQTCLPNSPTKISTSSYPPEIIKREILLPSEKVEGGNSINNKMSRTDKRTHDESLKHSSSVKSKAVKVKPSSASDNPDGIHGKGRRNSDVKTGRNATVSTLSAKKALVPSTAPLSPKIFHSNTASSETRKTGRLKLLSSLKDRNRMHKVETETSNSKDSVKTLRVIKTGTENTALESTPDDHNTISMEIGKVQPVKENHGKNLRMGTEKNTLESIPDDHAILALLSPSSPNSLSHEVDEDIKYSGNEPDELVSDNTVSMEIGKVQPVKKNNNKTLRVVAENNILESIPDEHVISALLAPSSPTLLSHTKSQSSLSHKDEDDDINYSGNVADEFVSVDTLYMEIGKVQPVKEYHNKILLMGTENDALEVIPDDNAIPAFPSPSSSESLSPSLLSEEEDDEEIKHSGGEADVFDSDNSVSMAIGEVQPAEKNHNKTLRKSGAVVSKDKFCSPVKLKFRSGRIVELRPVNNIPRRLKFRRARVNSNTIDDLASDNKNSLDDKKSVEIGNVQPAEENQEKTLRKSRLIASEDKYRSPLKLYRGERVVDLQSDNHSPRRLGFRMARHLVAEDDKSDWRTRTIRKTGGKDDEAGAGLSSQNVILKHQDMQGKRDAQGLFNNVIEETASKLVESRKSKVKALVGAFETVISLQDRKPAQA